MKRLLLIMLLLLTISSIALLYFFDINNHLKWISAQVEKHTDYQVSFDLIEIENWQKPQLTISALSIAYQNQPLLRLERLNIQSRQFDIWHRHLDIALVELQGLTIWADDRKLNEIHNTSKNSQEIKTTTHIESLLPWNSLVIDKIKMTDVNAEINYQGASLQLQKADLSMADLPIISDNHFVYKWMEGNWQLAVKAGALQLQSKQSLRFSSISLATDFNLLSLQAQLMLAIKQVTLSTPEFSDLVIDNSVLELQLENNKLILQRLSADAFSGQLQLQGEALFAFNPQYQPFISVDKLTILSLVMKDMQVHIPHFMTPSESETVSNDKGQWPINSVFIKQASLQNIDISSAEAQIPLNLKQGNVQLHNFQLLENNKLGDLFVEDKQMGDASLTFAYLQWGDTIIEEFQGKL